MRVRLAQCIVIGPVCNGRAGGACYHDHSKMRASIFTKLGLYAHVVTVSSWLKFGRHVPPEGGLRRGENFWLRLLQPARSVCVSLSAFFIVLVVVLTQSPGSSLNLVAITTVLSHQSVTPGKLTTSNQTPETFLNPWLITRMLCYMWYHN